jgi:hypothetical protein
MSRPEPGELTEELAEFAKAVCRVARVAGASVRDFERGVRKVDNVIDEDYEEGWKQARAAHHFLDRLGVPNGADPQGGNPTQSVQERCQSLGARLKQVAGRLEVLEQSVKGLANTAERELLAEWISVTRSILMTGTRE